VSVNSSGKHPFGIVPLVAVVAGVGTVCADTVAQVSVTEILGLMDRDVIKVAQ
jgi:hypothetical protein